PEPSYYVTAVESPDELVRADDPDELEGPNLWGRRTLTPRRALELMLNPPPPEEVLPLPGETKLTHLSDNEWLALAAATEGHRPVLRGVYVEDGVAISTDGHRKHR